MDQFVCVRMPQVNNIDLTRFQFDYDLTLAIFFMNADGTVYGRFGTRTSVDDATDDISLEGLAESMAAVLKLHEGYPNNKKYLDGKQAKPSDYKRPNDFPQLRGKYKDNIDYDSSKVVQSCLHCHQIRDAHRAVYRSASKPIPDRILYPYPMPDVLGLHLDPKHRAKVAKVDRGSWAAKAELEPGDEILTLEGQAIVSTADVQWVLHHAPDQGQLDALLSRGVDVVHTTLTLPKDWRHASKIDWRVTSWSLRRMGTGGMKVEAASNEVRRRAKLQDGQMALLVKHTGKYGQHAVAHRAGVKVNDVVVAFDGRTDLMNDSQLLAYSAKNTKPNQLVSVVVMRGSQRLEFKLKMQQ